MEKEDAAPTYTTTIPDEELSTGPASVFVAGLTTREDEDEDEEFSQSDTSAVFGAASIKLDFPKVMTRAAECVRLPLPPPLPPKPLSPLRQGFYGPAQPPLPMFISPALPDIWQCVKASWQELLKTKATNFFFFHLVNFYWIPWGCYATTGGSCSTSKPLLAPPMYSCI